jgi:hypothetical protein
VSNVISIEPRLNVKRKALACGAKAYVKIRCRLIYSVLAQRDPSVAINYAPHEMAFKFKRELLRPPYCEAFVLTKPDRSQKRGNSQRTKIGAKVIAVVFELDIICSGQVVNKLNQIRILATHFNSVPIKISIRPDNPNNPSQLGRPLREKSFIRLMDMVRLSFASLFFSPRNRSRAHLRFVFNLWPSHFSCCLSHIVIIQSFSQECQNRALCQRCHLAHDKKMHQQNSRKTRESKKQQSGQMSLILMAGSEATTQGRLGKGIY